MDMISQLEGAAKRLINIYPFQRFIRSVEVIVLIFLISFFVYDDPFPSLFFSIFVFFLIGAVIFTFIVLLYRYSIDIMGLLAILFILLGISIISLQVEGIFGRGGIYLANAAFITNSALAIGLGIFLLIKKVGNLSKKALFLSLWMFSLLLILYLPISKLYFPKSGFGFGEFSSGVVGGILSLMGFLSYQFQRFKENDIQESLTAGDTRRLLGDVDGSKKYYGKALEVDPDNMDVVSRLADLYFEKRDFSDALICYNKQPSWNEGRNYFRGSFVYSAIDEKQKALEYQKEALKMKTSAPRWTWMGILFRRKDDEEKAKECFSKALEEDQRFYPALFELGRLKEEEEKKKRFLLEAFKEAKEGAYKRKILKEMDIGGMLPIYLYPYEIEFWGRGRKGIDIDIAKELLRDLISMLDIRNPTLLEWGESRIECLSEDEDKDDELPTVNDRGEVEKELIECLIRSVKGEVKNALEGLSELLEKNIDERKKSEIQYFMGIILGVIDQDERSLELLEKVDDRELKSKVTLARAGVHYLKNDIKRCKEILKLYLFMDEERSEIWENLKKVSSSDEDDYQDIYFSLKSREPPLTVYSTSDPRSLVDVVEAAAYQRYEKAYEMLKKTYNTDEKDVGPLYEFIKSALYILKNEHIKGLETYKKLSERYPEKSECYFGLGRALFSLDKPKNALRRFNNALELKKDDPLYLFYRGVVLFKTKRFEKAKDDFMKVQKKRPGWNKNYHFLTRCDRHLEDKD